MTAPTPTALVTEFGSASTTHNCVMPATINAGDLLLLFFVCRGSVTFTTPTGWTIESVRTANSTVLSSIVYSKIAVGNEDGTNVNVVSSASGIAVGIAVRVVDWFGASLTDDVVSGTPSTANNLNVNPPSVSWAWGSSDDVLILAFPSIGSAGGSATPATNYTALADGSVGSGGTGLRGDVGYRQRLAAASPEDPSTFNYTSGATTNNVAHTVAIRGISSPVTATMASQLQSVLFNATGTQAQSGSIQAEVAKIVATLVGTQEQSGAMASSLQPLGFSASGSAAVEEVEGTLASSLQPVTSDIIGQQWTQGDLIAEVQNLLFNGLGTLEPEGNIASELQSLDFSGLVEVIFSGQIESSISPLEFNAIGGQEFIGNLAARLEELIFSGVGLEHPTGEIDAELNPVLFTGSGGQEFTGILSAELQELLHSGSGTVTRILTLPNLAQIEGVTRNEIFKRFLRETGLGTYGTVTGVSGGATTTFDDVTRLKSTQFNARDWVGAWARISKNADSIGAAPEGDVAPVTVYDPTTNGRITVSPAVSGNIAAGDEYELWRFPNPSFVIDDLDTVLREDIYLPCWTMLSEFPDFDMEQDNVLDWGAIGGSTLSKVGDDSSLENGRWLAITTTGGAAGAAFNNNEISVHPQTKYSVSVMCYNQDGNTLTLEAYDETNSVSINSKSWDGRFPGRIHFEFTTPSGCQSLGIYLRHAATGAGVLVSKWKELSLFPSETIDIALPWWVKNKSQIKAVFKLHPYDISGNDVDGVWDATLRGRFTNEFEIRDNAFGRGQLRLVMARGNSPGPMYIFGVRNETAFENDNEDIKRIDEDLLIACLATKVFRRLKTFPNSNAMQTTWIAEQYAEWQAKYIRASRQQSQRIEEVMLTYRDAALYNTNRNFGGL